MMWPTLRPYTIELLRIAWNDVVEDGIVDGVFDLDNPYVQDALKDIALRVTGVDDTIRDLIRSVTGDTALSITEKRDRLLDLAVTDSANRAELIALTETADAMERGNHLAWQASGVVAGSTWLLGPDPCPDCEELAGRTVPLGEEFAPGVKHPPRHPRCTCATVPELAERA